MATVESTVTTEIFRGKRHFPKRCASSIAQRNPRTVAIVAICSTNPATVPHGGHQCVAIVPIGTTVATEKPREIWGVSGLSLMDDAVEVALKLHVPLQLSLFGDFGLLENRFVQKSTFSRKISVVTVDKKMYNFPGKKEQLQRRR